jgi:predicted Na+-dependent transporter
MSRNVKIASGLLIPSLTATIILVLVIPYIRAMKPVDPMVVPVMLFFIVTSVASSAVTAFFFKGLSFPKKTDLLLLYLNAYPWIAFVVLFIERFWVLFFPLLFTPLLGYWFAKRYFSL